MSDNNIIAQELDKIYSASTKPVYISRLGQQLRSRGCLISGSLRRYIEDNFSSRYVVLQHDSIKEKIVISAIDDLEVTKALLQGELPGDEAEGIDKLLQLPRSFLIPFCRGDKDEILYVNVKPPFHYALGTVPVGEGEYHLVDQKYRCDIILPKNLKKVDRKKLELLWTNISNWANALGVDIGPIKKMYLNEEVRHVVSSGAKTVAKTALDRLIEAQSIHIRASFVIPMDIIALLSKH